MGDSVASRLAGAFRTVQADPRSALRAAEAELASCAATPSSDRAVVLWTKGMALRELSALADATIEFQSAVEEASLAGDKRLAGRIKVSLSLVLAQTGQFTQALQLLDDAEPYLADSDLAEAMAQRAVICQRAGQYEQAIASWAPAIQGFKRLGDALSQGKALANRGVARSYVASYRDAVADLDAAEALFRREGAAMRAAEAVHNRGFIASRTGNLPLALRLFDQSQREFGTLGVSVPVALVDRTETLLSAGLGGEALDVAVIAAAQLEGAGLETDLAELCLLAARAAEEIADLVAARRWAARALELFSTQGRPRWEALARFATVRIAAGSAEGPTDDELADVEAELASVGWPAAAFDAAVLRVKGLAAVDTVRARAVLDAARPFVAGLPASSRAQRWVAEAIVRRAEGRRAAALRALRASVQLLEQHQASLGAAELRVRAGTRVEQVTEIGASMALETGAAREVFAWLERGRAGALATHAVLPPADPDLADALARSRHIAVRLEREAIDDREALRLRRQLSALEEVVRRRSRHLGGDGVAGRLAVSPAAVASAVDHGVLLVYGAVDGSLVRISLTAGRWSVMRCGTLREATVAVDGLRHALVEHLSGPAGAQRPGNLVGELAGRAQDLLLGADVAPALGEAEPGVIIVPGPLHAMPWAALPALAMVPFSVAPSAAAWLAARDRSDISSDAPVLVVAGPGLGHAAPEAAAVAAVYRTPVVLTGEQATVQQVLLQLDRAEVAHVACHGSFRADNPQFSSLRLADGPLSTHDLSGIGHYPLLCVLSACDVGLADANGAGALGVAASLLGGGASAVLASVLPADDAHTPILMADFHRRLAAGEPGAVALSRARQVLDDRLVACGFTLYGASVRFRL